MCVGVLVESRGQPPVFFLPQVPSAWTVLETEPLIGGAHRLCWDPPIPWAHSYHKPKSLNQAGLLYRLSSLLSPHNTNHLEHEEVLAWKKDW